MIDETTALIERTARLMAAEGHTGGLKPVQWEALRYLARANRFSRSPGSLTRYLGSTKGTVSQTLMALARAGLIVKTVNPGDGRSVRVELTSAGREYVSADPIEQLRLSIALLSPSARNALNRGMRALLAAQLAAKGFRAFGMCRSCRYFGANEYSTGRHRCRLLDEVLSDDEAAQICHEQVSAA